MRPVSQEDKAFLENYDPSHFPPLAVTVDLVLLCIRDDALHTFLLRRKESPFRNLWALPGGFVQKDETLEATAERVLRTKVGISEVFFEQLFTFGAVERDPRMRILSVAYMALVASQRFMELPADGAQLARLSVPWKGLAGGDVFALNAQGDPLTLAFDHAVILATAVKRLRGKLDYTPVGFELLPQEFTLHQLQGIHEVVRAEKLNKDSFRRRMLASGQLEATGGIQDNVGHRPAALYRFINSDASAID